MAYHLSDDRLHKNGMGSAGAGGSAGVGLAQLQQYNDLYCDEDGHHLEQPSSTMETDRTGIEENGVADSVVSEEAGEEEQQGLQDGLNSTAGVDLDVNNDNNTAYDEPLDMEPVDYVQEEIYETVKEAENTHEAGFSNSDKVDNVINGEEKQKELESVDGKQDFEQLESTQSSQPVSSSSSSYNPSPVAHRKSTRVSVHRELDVNYEQSTTDNGNVRHYVVIASSYTIIVT